jgi:hypothetical protein
MSKLQEKADKLRHCTAKATTAWLELKKEFQEWGIIEKDIKGMADVQKWILRADIQSSELIEHIEKI